VAPEGIAIALPMKNNSEKAVNNNNFTLFISFHSSSFSQGNPAIFPQDLFGFPSRPHSRFGFFKVLFLYDVITRAKFMPFEI